ncbi:MAG: type II secretion system F family protein [Phycisphaerales bacterium]|nr:type II secretion system F family protein [Phycisphaerales bacterium]
MSVFQYTALNPTQQVLSGTLLAETPAEGRQSLRDQGLRILEFVPAKARERSRLLTLSSRRRREQVAESARYLSLLLRSGVPVVEALDVLTRKRRSALTTVLKQVRDRVTGGQNLAEALGEHPKWFDAVFVSAAHVGERSGCLEEALADLAQHLESSEKLRGQVTGALTYPLILVVLATAVVIFLMSRVIPQLLTVLQASGKPLPASTQFLKAFSDTLTQHSVLLVVMVAAFAACGTLVYRSPKGRLLIHAWQLRLPVAGTLIGKTVVARFAQQMCLLLRTGIPFVDAVRTVRPMTSHRVLQKELEALERSVESGGAIASSVENSAVFPPVVVHLLAVGQDTGELPAMLAQLKDSYESEVKLALQKFTAALEPLLIILLAGVVGFIVFACLMPILEATRVIQ